MSMQYIFSFYTPFINLQWKHNMAEKEKPF